MPFVTFTDILGFSVNLYLPKHEQIWMNPGIYVRGHGAHSHKNKGNRPGVPPKNAKRVLFFSVTNTTRTFGNL